MRRYPTLMRAMDPRVKQQYLEFMLVFASEFRNLPVHFGFRQSSSSQQQPQQHLAVKTGASEGTSRLSSSHSTPPPPTFVTQKFFLRLEPQHPGNAWIRAHSDLIELVGAAAEAGDGATTTASPSSSPSSSHWKREQVRVYTSYHRVKLAKEGALDGADTRSQEAVPTCYTYVFPAHELISQSPQPRSLAAVPDGARVDAAHATGAGTVPDEVRWWCEVRTRVLDPLLPLNWQNNQHWLLALHTHTHSHDSGSMPTALKADEVREAGPYSRAALAEAVMDANNTLTFRARVQQRFFQNACLTPGGDEVKRALARGRLEIRQLKEVAHVRKYRAMRKRYEWSTVRPRGGGGGTAEEQWWLGLENRDTYGYNELDGAVVGAEKNTQPER